MKTCISCHQLKPLEEFYTHPQMKDGRLNKCKSCCKSQVKQARIDDPQKFRQRDKQRNALPHRIQMREQYAKTHVPLVNEIKRRWSKRNPEKRAAHIAVSNAIRDGKLFPRTCEVCGKKAQAHHDDYSNPLEVKWLCPKHHKAADRILRRVPLN